MSTWEQDFMLDIHQISDDYPVPSNVLDSSLNKYPVSGKGYLYGRSYISIDNMKKKRLTMFLAEILMFPINKPFPKMRPLFLVMDIFPDFKL